MELVGEAKSVGEEWLEAVACVEKLQEASCGFRGGGGVCGGSGGIFGGGIVWRGGDGVFGGVYGERVGVFCGGIVGHRGRRRVVWRNG